MAISCEETGYSALFTFSDTTVYGSISFNDKQIYSIPSGNSLEEVLMRDDRTGAVSVLWNHSEMVEEPEMFVEPISKQLPNESRRVWYTVSAAIAESNYDFATEEKKRVEEEARTYRKSINVHEWRPKYFEKVDGEVENVPTFAMKKQ